MEISIRKLKEELARTNQELEEHLIRKAMVGFSGSSGRGFF